MFDAFQELQNSVAVIIFSTHSFHTCKRKNSGIADVKLLSTYIMPGRGAGSTQLASSSASHERAIEYLRSLSISEVRALLPLRDGQVGFTETTWATDGDMEDYRNDMIEDIRCGPLRGQGPGVVASFPRSLLQPYNARRVEGLGMIQSDCFQPDTRE